jgi:non-ribosomal peptide synthetase component F
LAAKLRDLGVKADDIVGVLMYRSLEMIIGILAIHKAGAAYMPMDPDYPIDRVQYMLENSGAKFFLSHDVVDTVVDNFQRVNVSNETLKKEPYRMFFYQYISSYTF